MVEAGWALPRRLLHWGSAGLVVAGFVLGWVMVAVPFRPLLLKFTLYQVHKSIGLLVLGFAVVRVGLLVRGRPGWAVGLSAREVGLARLGHAALLALLIVVPVLGYLVASTAALPVPTVFLGVLKVPHVLARDPALFAVLRQVHRAAACLLVLLAAGHGVMAVVHHRRGLGVLRGMWAGHFDRVGFDRAGDCGETAASLQSRTAHPQRNV